MLRIAWRSLTAHKLRTILTTLAILLGVAMISGTYVLTDQIDKGFEQIFTDAYKGVDVTVTRKAAFTGATVSSTVAGLPESLVAKVQGVDGVSDGGRLHRERRAPWPWTARSSAPEGPRRCSSRTRPAWRSCSPTTSSPAHRRPAPARSASSRSWPRTRTSAWGPRSRSSRQSGSRTATVSGVFTFAAQSSLGGSIIIDTTLPDAQALVRHARSGVGDRRQGRRRSVAGDAGRARARGRPAKASRSRPARRRPPTRPSSSATRSARSSSRRCSRSAASPCWSAPSSSSTRSR